MGGEGSIAGMINSLRNNANLLRKHVPIYKRRSEFIQARKVYQKNVDQSSATRPLSKAEQAERRARMMVEIRRELIIRRVKFVIFITAFIFAFYAIYNNIKRKVEPKSQQVFEMDLPPKSDEKVLDYGEYMSTGLQLLQENQWFYAAGYFEGALQERPGDSDAEYHLTLVHCLLCYNEGKGCTRAETLVSEMIAKYPSDDKYQILKSRYLESRK